MEEETEEIQETADTVIEKPKKKLSPKQLENLANGRNRLRKKVEETLEQKAQKKLEDRFDKLCAMLEKVQLPVPEVQQKIIAKRAKVAPEPVEEEEEVIPDPVVIVEKPRVAKPKTSVAPQPPRQQIMFSFK
jgi:hypothetical protein